MFGAEYLWCFAGLVYIVDASQPESFIRVKKDLSELLYERDLAELPLLVLANKQGLEGQNESLIKKNFNKNYTYIYSTYQIKTFFFSLMPNICLGDGKDIVHPISV